VLAQAAGSLAMPAAEITLEALMALMPAAEADRGRALSAELRGTLSEVSRVHAQNRILIRQELAFLDHLMRVLSGVPQAGYSPVGQSAMPQPANLIDMRV
jgi:hypothetical protein